MLDKHAPLGYQDETGFHFGAAHHQSTDGDCFPRPPDTAAGVPERRRAGRTGR
jgi:hypothetical protein